MPIPMSPLSAILFPYTTPVVYRSHQGARVARDGPAGARSLFGDALFLEPSGLRRDRREDRRRHEHGGGDRGSRLPRIGAGTAGRPRRLCGSCRMTALATSRMRKPAIAPRRLFQDIAYSLVSVSC